MMYPRMGMYLSEDVTTVAPAPAEKPWYQGVFDIIPAALQYQQQRDLLKANTELLKAGLQPISPSTIAPQVNVGVSSDLQKMMMFGLVGLLAVGLFAGMRRR